VAGGIPEPSVRLPLLIRVGVQVSREFGPQGAFVQLGGLDVRWAASGGSEQNSASRRQKTA
jgi:hypothetical protein